MSNNKDFKVKNGLDVGGSTVIDASRNITAGNITTTGYLRGPASFVIDPAAHGNDTGTVVIAGSLQVDGTTTTVNSTVMSVNDLNLTLADGAANAAAANGAGITIAGAAATLTYASTGDKFVLNKSLDVSGTVTTNSGGGNASLGSHLDLGDNQKARFGASDDLQIYHDGSHARLRETTGDFRIQTTSGGVNALVAKQNAEVEITHAGSTKLATTSTGIDVTGTVSADGLTVDNFTLDGTSLSLSSGDMTLDAAGRIDLSADDNGEIRFFDGSSMYGQIKDDDDRLKIQGLISNKAMMFAGNDNGSEVTALTLDMSNAGAATFNSGATFGGTVNANAFVGDGSSLTNLPAAGATDIDGLSDATTSGTDNIGLGTDALTSLTTGYSNTAIGDTALENTTSGLGNIAIGHDALNANTTKNLSIAIGHEALKSSTDGFENIAIGGNNSRVLTSGTRNTSVGAGSNKLLTTGTMNASFGHSALEHATTVHNNSTFGAYSLFSLTTGSSNTALGKGAGNNITTGSNNTVIGRLGGTTTMADTVLIGAGTTERLKIDSTGIYVNGSSTALPTTAGATSIDDLSDAISGDASSYGIGDGALPSDDGTTNSNIAIGQNSMASMVSGNSNVALGGYSLQDNVSGYRSTAIGHYALNNSVVANGAAENVAVGYRAGVSSTTGISNTLLGTEAGAALTTGSHNIFVGNGAGTSVSTGSDNTIIGKGGFNTSGSLSATVIIAAGANERLKVDSTGLYVNGSATALVGGASDIDGLTDGYYAGGSVGLGDGALENDDGSARHSTAVGYQALFQSTTGWGNVGLGYRAGRQVTDGYYNTAVGKEALRTVTTGDENTANGATALFHLSTGSSNSAFGTGAMYNATTGHSNSAFGRESLRGVTTGAHNLGIGYLSGDAITTGSNNTVIGYLSGTSAMADTVLIGAGSTERLKVTSTGIYVNGSGTALPTTAGATSVDGLSDATTSGTDNIGLGGGALSSNTTAGGVTAIGENALASNTSGWHNTAIGRDALTSLGAGSEMNTVVGASAGKYMTSGSSNVVLGNGALKTHTSGSYNTVVGTDAISVGSGGTYNTAIGYNCLKNNTGYNNVAAGTNTLWNNTTGYRNTAFGSYALSANTTAGVNIAIGYEAGNAITTGWNNTVIGQLSGTSTMSSTVLIGAGTTERLKIDSTGIYVNGSGTALPTTAGATSIDGLSDAKTLGTGTGESIGIGTDALDTQTGTNLANIAIGHSSQKGVSASGEGNISIGKYTLKSTTSGGGNTSIGSESMENNTTGGNNVAYGKIALRRNISGANNTAIGVATNEHSTDKSNNVAVGYKAMQNNTSGDTVAVGSEALAANTGTHNLAVGHNALKKNTSGSNNVGLGYTAGFEITTGSNNTIIGDLDGSSALSSTVLIGAGTTERLKIDSNGLYINGSAKRLSLDASGGDIDGNFAASGTITANSDERLKEDVKVIENPIEKIKAIRGVTYTRNDLEDKTTRHAGVIAQEVEAVLPEVVLENDEGIKSVAYGNIVSLLLEGMKEQQKQIDELRKKLGE